jgi:hypothetical protein
MEKQLLVLASNERLVGSSDWPATVGIRLRPHTRY